MFLLILQAEKYNDSHKTSHEAAMITSIVFMNSFENLQHDEWSLFPDSFEENIIASTIPMHSIHAKSIQITPSIYRPLHYCRTLGPGDFLCPLHLGHQMEDI